LAIECPICHGLRPDDLKKDCTTCFELNKDTLPPVPDPRYINSGVIDTESWKLDLYQWLVKLKEKVDLLVTTKELQPELDEALKKYRETQRILSIEKEWPGC